MVKFLPSASEYVLPGPSTPASYRGRPNYYNRNYSVGGGYNRGYRGGNNYRNRTNNRMGGTNDMGNSNENNAAPANDNNAAANLKSQQPQTPIATGTATNPSSAISSATKKTVAQEINTQAHMTPVLAGQ
ncbi:uncharacterized protein DDB_G0286379-like [Teleopsis dalmanni]|uniref:uncharacterized protein DDB_G0286379-like n=1 Tax=Teleopsis dalmanni TaxID=139649 RepID=UPI0018CF0562|nr:uncharacterized protein DDB_G0286379-like [Teleopsis dalmanni]